MSEPIKIMLIDDHPLFRKGVGQIISDDPAFVVVGEAASGFEGLELAPALEPDIILLDLNMKGMNGLETLRRFKASGLKTHVVIMTVSDAEDDLLEALRSGAEEVKVAGRVAHVRTSVGWAAKCRQHRS